MTAILDRPAKPEAPLTLAEPAPKVLGLADQLGLWANLGVTLTLPAAAGFLLVPGLSVVAALIAVVVGSLAGSALLALATIAGARTGQPAMVLLRGLFGLRGSYLPTILNVAQCLGWTIVEIVIIAEFGHGLTSAVPRWVFVLAAGAIATGLALRPLGFVRVLRRYAVVLVVLSSVYLAVQVLRHPLPSLTAGGFHGFPAAVDVVIAIPVSWIPLAADYSRHSRDTKSAGWGAFAGFGVACSAYFALGLLAVVAFSTAAHPVDGQTALLAVPAAGLALAFLVADELDEAFANLYSTAISTQNAFPRADRRWLVLGVGGLATVLALGASYSDYEAFLFLIGAVFLPLIAVFAVDFFLVRRGAWDTTAAARPRPLMFLPWLVGSAAYELVAPTAISWWPGWASWWVNRQHDLSFAPPGWLSASLTAFVVAVVLAVPCALVSRPRASAEARS